MIRDLSAILDFYESFGAGVAGTMLARISASPEMLLERPLLGPTIGLRGVRKWSVRRTPFVLRYRIAGNHEIEILRVHHTAQNWQPE